MKDRCRRPVGSAECGLPLEPKSQMSPYGNHWPHRYIEVRVKDRLPHEWKLWRTGYTSFFDFLRATFLKRARLTDQEPQYKEAK